MSYTFRKRIDLFLQEQNLKNLKVTVKSSLKPLILLKLNNSLNLFKNLTRNTNLIHG